MSRKVNLSAEQLLETRRLWPTGESQQGIASAIGITVDTFNARLLDQLADLPKRPRTAHSERRGIEITPDEIAIRAAECRARWTPERWLPTPTVEAHRLGRMAGERVEFRG
jgi:hypothetical protein